MRRLALLPLILILVAALAACGGTKAPASDAPATNGGGDGNVPISQAVGDPLPAGASAPPRPTEQPALGLVVQNVEYKAQGNGNVTFTAQVLNLGTQEVRATKVVLELYDAAGQRITRMSFSEPGLPTLKPGEGASWKGQRGGLTVQWAEIRATAAAEPLAAAR